MKQAELLRQIRKNKGISQKDLTAGICARSTLATYENGKTEYLSSEFLLMFLDRLNYSPSEFFFELKKDSTKQVIKNKIQLACDMKDQALGDIQDIATNLSTEYKKTHDIFYLAHSFKASELFEQHQSVPFCNTAFRMKHCQEIDLMLNYLFAVQSFGSFEFEMFDMIIDYIEPMYINRIIAKIITRLDFSYAPNIKIFLQLIFKAEMHLLELQKFDEVQQVAALTSYNLTHENIHFKIVSRFISDLMEELDTHKFDDVHYSYLTIYSTMGFPEYETILRDFRQHQLREQSA